MTRAPTGRDSQRAMRRRVFSSPMDVERPVVIIRLLLLALASQWMNGR